MENPPPKPQTKRQLERQAKKARLLAWRDELRAKYGHLTDDDEAPEELLAYTRECIRFGVKNLSEYYELSLKPLPKW